MEVVLENAREKFIYPSRNSYYEGMSSDGFTALLRLIGYVIPNKVTPEELLVFIRFLIMDLKEEKCRFYNSEEFKRSFNDYLSIVGNVEMWMTYIPSYLKVVAEPDFYSEFIELFKSAFYQQRDDDKDDEYGCVEIEKDVIDISRKDKAEVLAELYNHAKPIGMGIVQYDPTPMTIEIARVVLEKMGPSFGYLKGRAMKVYLGEDELYVGNYNRDNDEDGLAQRAIAKCRNVTCGDGTKKLILKSEK